MVCKYLHQSLSHSKASAIILNSNTVIAKISSTFIVNGTVAGA